MTLNIRDEINKAEREIADSLKTLEALLKERGMRFSAEIAVEPRRVL